MRRKILAMTGALVGAAFIGVAAQGAAAGTAASAGSQAAKPGTTLKYGKSAVVLYKDPLAKYNASATGLLRITVTSVTKAKASDFKGVQLNASEKPGDMYYVRYSITNIGTTNVNKGDEGGPSLEADDSSGQEATDLTILGTFPACSWHAPPKPFPKGKTWTNCDIYDAPKGILKVAYTGNVNRYYDKAVIWK
ncbi:MAG TPA: hypothetical protein VHU61_04710 [Solirubrobacteraceae bacterium]|nr:hypothetical protein [Solirubrobacteraceae bacterium]